MTPTPALDLTTDRARRHGEMYDVARVEGKVYRGQRHADRRCTITVLDFATGRTGPLAHIERHSPTGLEWGFGGSGPADTALSILADHFGDLEAATEVYHRFKEQVVAAMPQAGWLLTSCQITTWLRRHAAAQVAATPAPSHCTCGELLHSGLGATAGPHHAPACAMHLAGLPTVAPLAHAEAM